MLLPAALRRLPVGVACALMLAAALSVCRAADPIKVVTVPLQVAAPFAMPPIPVPDFASCPRFVITDFGAKLGDKRATSAAIDAAIKQANEAGGGTVVIPAGEWLTGKIHFRSHVNLHLDAAAVLVFSEDPNDYLPPVKTTWEGMECYNYSPLLYAYECRNIAITGSGKLRAKLDVWRVWYARPPAHLEALKKLYAMASTDVPVEQRQMVGHEANMRPQFIQFNRCENVLLEGVSIEDSPFWVIHPFLSKNIVIRNVRVKAHGHNNDGVDPEMSQNLLIENCVFDQGDDAIAVKSGRNRDAWRLATPSKNIVIRHCLVRNAHQLVAVGSELSGGVENLAVHDCELDPAIKNVGHLLFIKTNERRGGMVDGIHMWNIKAGALKFGVLGIETDVMYQWRTLVPTYEKRLTAIRNVTVDNISVGDVKFISHIEGQAALPVENVSVSRVRAAKVLEAQLQNRHVNGFKFAE